MAELNNGNRFPPMTDCPPAIDPSAGESLPTPAD